jgi:DNA (cytosine-5)-methyltransferase 1
MSHKFPYKWYLKDGYPEKNGLKVFSCFACGGGSTMGYKLAGFDVVGANEIDPKMAECYKVNHNPRHLFVEPIQEFKLRKDMPPELFNLDILDGSPPCSSFSSLGNREKDWGKKKKFKEGQADQVLDTLFFDFIDLAERLQPKVVIAENVKGLLQGDAKKYVWKIYQAFDKAGYHVHKWLLDASNMGVPQKRERVIFVAIRKDLVSKIEGVGIDLFNPMPHLNFEFNESNIFFKDIYHDYSDSQITGRVLEIFNEARKGETDLRYAAERLSGKQDFFSYKLTYMDSIPLTIVANDNVIVFEEKRYRNFDELCKCGSYPKDYNFIKNKPKYLIGMSVPPVMTAQIATRIKEQWFDRMIL